MIGLTSFFLVKCGIHNIDNISKAEPISVLHFSSNVEACWRHQLKLLDLWIRILTWSHTWIGGRVFHHQLGHFHKPWTVFYQILAPHVIYILEAKYSQQTICGKWHVWVKMDANFFRNERNEMEISEFGIRKSGPIFFGMAPIFCFGADLFDL